MNKPSIPTLNQHTTKSRTNTFSLAIYLSVFAHSTAVVLITIWPQVTESVTFWVLLIAVWASWVVAFVSNFRLVSCGTVKNRYQMAGSWVNSPGLLVRTTLHVLVNWSAVSFTVYAQWLIDSEVHSITLGAIAVTGAIVTWLLFNLRHKRKDRFRNITLSTSFAIVLVFSSTYLLLT